MKRCIFLALMALTLALVAAPAWAATLNAVAVSGDTAVTVVQGETIAKSYTATVSDDMDSLLTESTDYTLSWTETEASALTDVAFDETTGEITVAATAEAGTTTIKFKATATGAGSYASSPPSDSSEFSVTVTVVTPTIALTPTTETVKVGETRTLTATTTPAGLDVKWKSADENIAKVVASGDHDVEGVVTGVASTDVVITAYLTISEDISADCTVTVTSADKSVTVDPKTKTIAPGETVVVEATPSPASEDVIWTNLAPSIVSMDPSGDLEVVVTGLAIGSANIRAALSNDSSVSADCVVTVAVATTISLDRTAMTIDVGGTEVLTATVSPLLGTPVSWDTSDSSVASVMGSGNLAMITGVKAGTAKVTATAGTATATCAVTVTGSAPTDSGIGSVGIPTVDADGDVSLLITSSDGTPARDADVDFWLELVSLTTSGVRASAVGEVYGRFVARTSSDGYLKIDPDALSYADGKKGSIPAGRYDVYVAKRGAVSSYADAKKAPVSVSLDATTPTGHSSGGCSAGFGALALIAAAAAATRRKR